MTDPADETKRAAFFAAIPDPPTNPLVALAAEHEAADDGADPKDAAPSQVAATSGRVAAAAAGSAKAAPDGAADAPLVDRVVAALKAGDLDQLADLTDQDPSSFDEKSTKWAARNRKEAKLKDEIAQVRADASAIVAHYEPLDTKVAEFHSTKNYALVKDIVELLLGEDFDSATMKTFRAVRTQDPRVPALTKQLAEKDAALAETKSAKTAAAERALVEAVRDDLPDDHQVRKLPEWETRVVAELRDSVDEDTGEPSLSFKQAAQRVLRKAKTEYEKYAGAFGGGATPAKDRAKTPERAGGTSPSTKRKLTRDEFFASFAGK